MKGSLPSSGQRLRQGGSDGADYPQFAMVLNFEHCHRVAEEFVLTKTAEHVTACRLMMSTTVPCSSFWVTLVASKPLPLRLDVHDYWILRCARHLFWLRWPRLNASKLDTEAGRVPGSFSRTIARLLLRHRLLCGRVRYLVDFLRAVMAT